MFASPCCAAICGAMRCDPALGRISRASRACVRVPSYLLQQPPPLPKVVKPRDGLADFLSCVLRTICLPARCKKRPASFSLSPSFSLSLALFLTLPLHTKQSFEGSGTRNACNCNGGRAPCEECNLLSKHGGAFPYCGAMLGLAAVLARPLCDATRRRAVVARRRSGWSPRLCSFRPSTRKAAWWLP